MAVNAPFTALQVMQTPRHSSHCVERCGACRSHGARLGGGGIRMLEVTLRTPQALACMEAIAKEVPDAVVGAGTVRSAADAKAAANAGANFGRQPWLHISGGPSLSRSGFVSCCPGVATGSEIMMAQEDGYTELKFFPAMQAGGPAMLKAWGGPFLMCAFALQVASTPRTPQSS
jgi:2-dehydro-3-deoxyphosphogluconate aldolase/(4S)-4-hydroxy-2-oxoglutarate aldolase